MDCQLLLDCQGIVKALDDQIIDKLAINEKLEPPGKEGNESQYGPPSPFKIFHGNVGEDGVANDCQRGCKKRDGTSRYWGLHSPAVARRN